MRNLAFAALLAGSAALSGCAVTPVPVALAPGQVCGTYGMLDADNNGSVTVAEWNAYRSGAYGGWDMNGDGRISRSEFQSCYQAGGFAPAAYYQPTYWDRYWTAFDANGDGFLSADEYWSTQSWSSVDRNNNGILDSNEWVWWTP